MLLTWYSINYEAKQNKGLNYFTDASKLVYVLYVLVCFQSFSYKAGTRWSLQLNYFFELQMDLPVRNAVNKSPQDTCFMLIADCLSIKRGMCKIGEVPGACVDRDDTSMLSPDDCQNINYYIHEKILRKTYS